MKRRRVTVGKCTAVAAFLLVALRHNHLSTEARRDEETSERRSSSVLKEEDGERPWQGHAVNGTAAEDPFVDAALEGRMHEAGAAPAATTSMRRASESSTFYSDGDDEGQHSGYGSTRVSNRACPYVIHSEKEALARASNTSIPGNIVKIEHLRFCRTGNHFSTVFRNLALGYCCKSKLVWLPPKDDILAPGIFNEGNPGPRWFDFSSAPDVEGFESVSCRAHITWAGQRAFHMDQLDTPGHSHYNPTLRECVKKVPRLLGCEAAYYFPMDIDVCLGGELKAAAGEVEEGEGPSAGHGWKRRISDDVRLQGDVDDRRVEGEDGGGGDNDADGEEEKVGKLVLHVRSGDIFKDDVLWYYGQPPLQFYMYIIGNRKWDRIDVITNAENSTSLNPVVPALQAKKDNGELPENLHIHTNRSMAEDLRSMMCADALGMARSTLVALTSFHSTATRIYGPVECNEQLAQLAKVRPEAQVYGLSWPRQYSVYQNWENTPDQREEMLKYSNITGLLQCTG